MILEDGGIVESGFRALDAHLRAGPSGFVDLLGADATGGLVLIEIERTGEDELLSRLLSHHAWVASHQLYLRRLYGNTRIHPFRTPRAVILADRFSAGFLDEIGQLPFAAKPFVYRLLMAGDEPALYLEAEEAAALLEEEHFAPAGDEEKGPAPVQAERLTPAEVEAFYRYERERLAATGGTGVPEP